MPARRTLLLLLLLTGFFCPVRSVYGQIPTSWGNRTIAAGSRIIDLSSASPTAANSLKPYGLVYELLKTYKIPILWAIKPNKTKDAVDFTQDGISYKTGAFIIEAAFLSTAVNNAITTWTNQGVIVRTTTTAGSIPVFMQLNAAPNWTIDQDNPNIATGIISDAGIPASSYTTKTPANLNSCDNIFAMPHADPTWATHNRIYSWVKPLDSANGCRGWFWGGCHATSVNENMVNPAASWQKMNFLSTNGLVLFSDHHNGSAPYINDSFPSHPFMQWLGTVDNATNNGSERIFMPKIGSAWRPTTQVGVYDPTQQDVPGLSPGKAAVLLFGPAFGNYNGGYVMYEAGHDVSGNNASNVAAERAFLNFSFLAPAFQPQSVIAASSIPDTIYAGNTIPVSVTVTGNGAPFTYLWTSTCSGVGISSPTSAATNIYFPTSSIGNCTITVTVTNACGKVVFLNKPVRVMKLVVLPLSLTQFSVSYTDNRAKLYWEAENETAGSYYEVERSINGTVFNPISRVPVSRNGAGVYMEDDPDVNTLPTEYVYYRLRYTTADGKQQLSTVKAIHLGTVAITQPTVNPNPARNDVNIRFYAKSAGLAGFTLLDAQGALVTSRNIKTVIGENNIHLDNLDKFPGGVYNIIIRQDNKSVTNRFIILQ